MSAERIYADHNATSPLRPEIAARAAALFGADFANPSSAHGAGREARALIETARARVAALVGAEEPGRVVFTASATEANALALEGHLRASQRNKLVVSAIEHPSVLENARRLKELGAELVLAPVLPSGVIDLAALASLLPGAGVCALMWANNETGAVQPIAEAAALCKDAGVRLHVDATQGVGKLPPARLAADTIALSAHKLGALPGIGALCTFGAAPAPILSGGGQQGGLRGGTEPVPQIALFGEVAELWRARGEAFRANMRAARDTFEQTVAPLGANATGAPRLPNTSNLHVPGVRGEALLSALDLEGAAVSHGAACATGSLEPSHVLLAMGLPREDARSSLRVSFGPEASAAEGRALGEMLLRCRDRLRRR